MNKSYIEITETCQLLDYQENPKHRVESWIGEEGIWKCYWYISNDGAIPNNYTLEVI